MAFLDKNILECLSARVTDLGRKRISEGNFDIVYFKVGDSEFDYQFHNLDQYVMHPMEMDCDLKYPILMDTQTKLDYGTVGTNHSSRTLTENLSEMGMFSGGTMTCGVNGVDCIYLSTVTGGNLIYVNNASLFADCQSIALVLQDVAGTSVTISSSSKVYFYNVVSVDTDDNVITVDRPTPDLSASADRGFVACVDCEGNDWQMNIVWTQKPAGLDATYENLSGYGSNDYASAKEYFGYTQISGQTPNTSTTYRNSMGDLVTVDPLDQRTIAVIHNSGTNFDLYDDWLAHDAAAQAYFQLSLPFILYHRATGSTVGATFYMSADFGYVRSTKNGTGCLGEKYHYLVDDTGNRVGKIFVHKRVIVIDDQEIIAALSTKANRSYTLPAPRVTNSSDLPCAPLTGDSKNVYVTYVFDDGGMHCNYYGKLAINDGDYSVSLKFGDEFQYMSTSTGTTGSFAATTFEALVQVVDAGTQPDPDNWTVVDLTDQIPNHTSGAIDPANLVSGTYVITTDMVDDGTLYDLTDYVGALPLENGGQDEPQFGDERGLPGSVRATRATNIHTMDFLVNLPETQFTTSQNPTKIDGSNTFVTEIGLFNSRKELMVIAKASHPHERIGFQQFSIQIDF